MREKQFAFWFLSCTGYRNTPCELEFDGCRNHSSHYGRQVYGAFCAVDAADVFPDDSSIARSCPHIDAVNRTSVVEDLDVFFENKLSLSWGPRA